MRESVTAYIGLGANLGDASAAVVHAMQEIAAIPGVTLTRRSALYATKPHEAQGPDYVNAVLEVSTRLAAHDLLRELQAIELRAGRLRPYRNAPRTLDLDVLLFGQESIAEPDLVVPHPRMTQRAFVLIPLAEIAPQCVNKDWLYAVREQAIARLG
ncbi:MAG: 2-amino-4-hydroxy-6-hydroxymethyldihydropteridine diphosphokinase [Rhodoferax sp.]|nr:2-amino-4-hydroxy-6-hydroxymethyldihydropteridine diphosphokinase [Rhodoferax sp.]